MRPFDASCVLKITLTIFDDRKTDVLVVPIHARSSPRLHSRTLRRTQACHFSVPLLYHQRVLKYLSVQGTFLYRSWLWCNLVPWKRSWQYRHERSATGKLRRKETELRKRHLIDFL